MAIMNMLPGGGGGIEIPEKTLPILIMDKNPSGTYYNTSLNITLRTRKTSTSQIKTALRSDNVITSTDNNNYLYFYVIDDFVGYYRNGSDVEGSHLFEKNKYYALAYYYDSNKYYFKIGETTDDLGSPSTWFADYNSSTNRWNSQTYGLLYKK